MPIPTSPSDLSDVSDKSDKSDSRPSLLAAATVLLLLLAGAAFAQEESEEESQDDPAMTVQEELFVEDRAPYLPETVSTVTKTTTPMQEIPASVSSLSYSLLSDRNALILGDALTNVAGVNAQSNSGVHDFFFLRGFDSLSSSRVLTDGVPEPEATFYQLYNVERVEVVRGPAGFLYGGDTIAGAVNMVRKRPLGSDEGRLGVLFGSHSTVQTTLDLNHASESGNGRFRLNGLLRSSDGYRDDHESDVYALNPVYTFLAGDRTAVTVSAEVHRSEFTPDAGTPLFFGEIPDVPRERSYQTPFDFSDQQMTRLLVEVESRRSERLTVRNKTYFNVLDWETRGTLINAVVPDFLGNFNVLRTRNVLDDRQELLGNQLDAVVTFGSGSVQHTLTAGVEVAHLADELQLDIGLLPAIDLFNPVETAPEEDFLLPGFGSAADTTTVVLAPYLLDEIQLSERWRVFVGGRFDYLDFEDDLSGAARTDSELSPFAGVLFAPTGSVSLYANYGQSFAPPSTLVTGAEREPEEGEQVEVGVKTRHLGGRLRTTVAVYDLTKDNIAILDATGVTAQLGEQESQGVEVEVSASLSSNLHWTLTYAYTDAELLRFTEFDPFTGQIVDRSGNVPAYTPEHLANFWISRRFDHGLGLSGGVRYVGEQFIDEDNAFTIDDYILVDALISYELERWGARLHLRNLTDEEYQGRGFGNASVLPADGFNVLGGLTYHW
jgi:TonB-dependent siderophore receptor